MPNENRTPTATTSVARLIYHGLSDDREHHSGCGSEQYGWGYSLLKGVRIRRYIRYLERIVFDSFSLTGVYCNFFR